jgi:hypothetical protein
LIAPQRFDPVNKGAGHAPLRRAGSIRRTTSIDSHWPDGQGAPWIMSGAARDAFTPTEGGAPQELSSGSFRIKASQRREILEIAIFPDHARAQELVGVRAGGSSRDALAASLGDLRGTPVYQLLDDFAGASLVAGWIWSQWSDDWLGERFSEGEAAVVEHRRRMTGICTGFAQGASSLENAGMAATSLISASDVLPLENPDDPQGWHIMPPLHGPRMRRARRMDLWRQDDLLRFDLGFQDSGSNPRGSRTAIHEYRVHGEIDERSFRLVTLQALPLILPFVECPGAAIKATRLIGMDVSGFRKAVPEVLASTLGCTHLNDVLRALADVPALARMLPPSEVRVP